MTTEQHQAGGPDVGGSLAGPASLTRAQLNALLAALDPARVRKDDNGAAHLPQWDVRRTLIEIFGPGGYSTKTLETILVAARTWVDGDGVRQFAVTYRMLLKLKVKDRYGRKVGSWEASAVGYSESTVEGAAHHVALTSAESLALKRAAINLGNQFGLGLYDGGSTAPVVRCDLTEEPDADALLEEIATAPTHAAMNLISGRLVGLARVGAISDGLYEDLREAGIARAAEIRQARAARAAALQAVDDLDVVDIEPDGEEPVISGSDGAPSVETGTEASGADPDADPTVLPEQPMNVVDVVAIDGDSLGAAAEPKVVRRSRSEGDDPWQTAAAEDAEVPSQARPPGTDAVDRADKSSPNSADGPDPAQSQLLADGLKTRLREAGTQSDLGRVASEAKRVKDQLTPADRDSVREMHEARVAELKAPPKASKAS